MSGSVEPSRVALKMRIDIGRKGCSEKNVGSLLAATLPDAWPKDLKEMTEKKVSPDYVGSLGPVKRQCP